MVRDAVRQSFRLAESCIELFEIRRRSGESTSFSAVWLLACPHCAMWCEAESVSIGRINSSHRSNQGYQTICFVGIGRGFSYWWSRHFYENESDRRECSISIVPAWNHYHYLQRLPHCMSTASISGISPGKLQQAPSGTFSIGHIWQSKTTLKVNFQDFGRKNSDDEVVSPSPSGPVIVNRTIFNCHLCEYEHESRDSLKAHIFDDHISRVHDGQVSNGCSVYFMFERIEADLTSHYINLFPAHSGQQRKRAGAE